MGTTFWCYLGVVGILPLIYEWFQERKIFGREFYNAGQRIGSLGASQGARPCLLVHCHASHHDHDGLCAFIGVVLVMVSPQQWKP